MDRIKASHPVYRYTAGGHWDCRHKNFMYNLCGDETIVTPLPREVLDSISPYRDDLWNIATQLDTTLTMEKILTVYREFYTEVKEARDDALAVNIHPKLSRKICIAVTSDDVEHARPEDSILKHIPVSLAKKMTYEKYLELVYHIIVLDKVKSRAVPTAIGNMNSAYSSFVPL